MRSGSIDLPIPGNDDAIRSIHLLVSALADAALEGAATRSEGRTQEVERRQEEPTADAEVNQEKPPAEEAVHEAETAAEPEPEQELQEQPPSDPEDSEDAETANGDSETT